VLVGMALDYRTGMGGGTRWEGAHGERMLSSCRSSSRYNRCPYLFGIQPAPVTEHRRERPEVPRKFPGSSGDPRHPARHPDSAARQAGLPYVAERQERPRRKSEHSRPRGRCSVTDPG